MGQKPLYVLILVLVSIVLYMLTSAGGKVQPKSHSRKSPSPPPPYAVACSGDLVHVVSGKCVPVDLNAMLGGNSNAQLAAAGVGGQRAPNAAAPMQPVPYPATTPAPPAATKAEAQAVPVHPPQADAGGITLMISFFASNGDHAGHPHYDEMLGAIRANILNAGVLSEMVVMFEPSKEIKCADFVKSVTGPLKGETLVPLRCHEQAGGQPTYFDLFTYANTQPDGAFKGSTVILANADIVFDKTLAHLPAVDPSEGYILSVNVKPDATMYQKAVGKPMSSQTTTPDARCPWPRWKNANTKSWDGFVIRPPLPKDFEATAAATGNTLKIFPNQIGAENRAKCALQKNGLEVINICLYVRVQHYHRGTQQMHHESGDKTGGVDCNGASYPCQGYLYGPKEWHVVDSNVCAKYHDQHTSTPRGKALYAAFEEKKPIEKLPGYTIPMDQIFWKKP